MYMDLKSILLSGFIMIILDYFYLSTISSFFNKLVKNIQGKKIKLKLSGVIMCYVILLFGLNHFIISQNKSPYEASLLGLVIYGIYESTNYAIFDKWNLEALVLDTIWGGVLFYLTTYATYKLKTII